jgi:cytochrome c oxidase assembly protein subunit 15
MASATSMIGETAQETKAIPRWLHWWAIVTVLAAFPLLLLGAVVTTQKVGMVDSVGLRPPLHLFEVGGEKLEEKNIGFLIEHSHRTFGWLVGVCSIVLAVGLGFFQKNALLRWLGVACLAGVCIQGVLGIYRVNLNAQGLAFIHGCFAQLVFALLVGTAYLTGVRENPSDLDAPKDLDDVSKVHRLAFITTFTIYGQIVLGAIVRHTEFNWGPRLHLVLAFIVLTLVMSLWLTYRHNEHGFVGMGRPLSFLVILLGLQLLLGVEAWMSKFATPEWNQLRPLISNVTFRDMPRSFHALVGAFLFADSVVVALASRLALSPGLVRQPRPSGNLEAAL